MNVRVPDRHSQPVPDRARLGIDTTDSTMTSPRADDARTELVDRLRRQAHLSRVSPEDRALMLAAATALGREPADYNSDSGNSTPAVRSDKSSAPIHELLIPRDGEAWTCDANGCDWIGHHSLDFSRARLSHEAAHPDTVAVPRFQRAQHTYDYAAAANDLRMASSAVHRVNIRHRKLLTTVQLAQLAAVDILVSSLTDEANAAVTRMQGRQS